MSLPAEKGKPSTTLPGTVEKIIKPIDPKEEEKAQIRVEGAEELYREIRVPNTLTDDKGTQYRLHSDKDINEHVGNMVEIKGTIKKEGADSQKASTSPAKEIDVADIKNVSKGCAAGTK